MTPSDIVGLPDFSCFARVKGRDRAPQVFRVDTRKVDEGDARMREAIQTASRNTYGRDWRQVDQWIRLASDLQGPPDLFGKDNRRGDGLSIAPIVAAASPSPTPGSPYGDHASSIQKETGRDDLLGDVALLQDVPTSEATAE